MSATAEGTGVAVFVRSGDALALSFAIDVSITALAAGDAVLVGLFQTGLRGWVDALRGNEAGLEAAEARGVHSNGPRGDRGFRDALRALGGPSLGEAIGRCRELGAGGRFEVLGCSAAAEALGMDPDTLVREGREDDIVGLPTIWRRARGRRLLSV